MVLFRMRVITSLGVHNGSFGNRKPSPGMSCLRPIMGETGNLGTQSRHSDAVERFRLVVAGTGLV
jgi:hypothetical protein